MKTVLHKADTRGKADHGWLNTRFSFSFAQWQDPERIHFGALRVLNDDYIAEGMGFGMHPHDNMEIITIPMSGQLEHKDSMGNTGIISKGEVQVMSAGTGIYHSEYNKNKDQPVSLFQIWIFPDKKNVTPRYAQKEFDFSTLKNSFRTIVSPMGSEEGLNIHQNAWFSIGKLDKESTYTYELKDKTNGVYAFIIEGSASINNEKLERRDALGISETEKIEIKADSNLEILLIEIPMY
jgi:redox-sensitive bicupin YhaK (pirin superfamily)